MTTKPTKSTTKNKLKKRPAEAVVERGKRIQLGCADRDCRGVCSYVYVDDEAALQCAVCGMIYKMENGFSRVWFFTE